MPLITEEVPDIMQIQEKIVEQTKQVQLENTPTVNVNNNDSDLYLMVFVAILVAILVKYLNTIIKLLLIVGVCFLAYTFLI